MIIGVLMLIGTGLAWSFVGVLISSTARARFNIIRLFSLQLLFSGIIAVTIFPDYKIMRENFDYNLLLLMILMLVAGAINAAGLLVIRKAMSSGHHGISWAIGQSALVIPFLLNVIIFTEPLTVFRLLGVLSILVSLFLYSRIKTEKKLETEQASINWLGLVLLAFVIMGTAQILFSLPSKVPELKDIAGIRIPLIYLGNLIVYIVFWLKSPGRPSRLEFTTAAFATVISLTGSFLFFNGLDNLASYQAASIGYPLASGTCILGFIIYSLVAIKENFSKWHFIGIASGILGIFLISI